ncbi:GtrA family protein [Enterobacter hormaechei]|uniref:GtrA family protein n=1 Tax=Enterobacter hormaechei TaxID=158836 RepID=UPI0007508FFB|nr:GtrA family protein [Enterobacter hormaechei]EIY4985254.1 GtrA family protein [Klebsiella quasipneumoniae]EIY5121691.1 GtrA family protein [Klebsiella quasipneumoniae]EIY5465894.1 GtrA family protein [Klebsiella quasipneumoniae]KUR02932.1 translocase [Enterobacter hormaechei subsp. xiangfangensis]
MIKIFSRYVAVAIVATILYWIVFSCFVFVFKYTQAISNLIAFSTSVTYSFFAHARFTFNARVDFMDYVWFVAFMLVLSYFIGRISDTYTISPLITVLEFSAIGLVCSFLFSRYVVFSNKKKT